MRPRPQTMLRDRGIRGGRDCAVAVSSRCRPDDAAAPMMATAVGGRGAGLPHRCSTPSLHAVRDGAVRVAAPRVRGTTWDLAAACGPHHVRGMAERMGRRRSRPAKKKKYSQ